MAVDIPHLMNLQAHHRTTSGTVIRTIPNSHGTVVVQYVVNDVSYVRNFAPYPYVAGTAVQVFYRPDDPSISAIENPSDIFLTQIPSALGATILMSAPFVLYLLVQKQKIGRKLVSWPIMTDPRITSTVMTLGILIIESSALLQPCDLLRIAGDISIISGCFYFLYITWRWRLSWHQLVRSTRFWVAALLGVVGDVILRLR
jgi:hypothetical protein